MAFMLLYGKKHSNDFFSRTTGPIWLIFSRKHIGHLPLKLLKSFRSRGSDTGPSLSSCFIVYSHRRRKVLNMGIWGGQGSEYWGGGGGGGKGGQTFRSP